MAHSEEKRAAVLAALLAGQSVGEIAESYQIPERTVWRWREAKLAEIVREKKERISEKLLTYLDGLFETLIAQQKVFRDETYLKEQSAAEVATLHGVLCDKGFRILEALTRTETDTKE